MTNTINRDTGATRLPALAKVNLQDKALQNWVNAVTERMQVREGELGNGSERTVTQRELNALLGNVSLLNNALVGDKEPGPGEAKIILGPGVSATVRVDDFARGIINSPLFQDLAKSLDDPTRFDYLAKEIRDVLLRDIADEAAKRGAAIQDVQTIVQDNERSLAMAVREVTASLQSASAGIRSTQAAFANGQKAQAVSITQARVSLGNYYQDGKPGRASLEQTMTVQASYTEGLRAQYTLKVQAGGALAGFGIAAEERNGQTSSAFIIMADKFAIVSPSYSGGLLKTPRTQDVVFGVDADGIYFQNNVYLKGNLRIDGNGRRLGDGMRGSLQVAASGNSWSDYTAAQAIWQALGNGGSYPNTNHLVIGDSVTMTGPSFWQTRQWLGTQWLIPGAVLNGDLLVDGTIAARKINTNGLTVRDNSGNVILDANGIDAQWLRNLRATQVQGLGPMATQSSARIGQNVTFPDGSVMNTGDFINRLQRITTNNIGVFMDTAAIGTAYIGQAAVGTLQIGGNAVTVPVTATVPGMQEGVGFGNWKNSLYMAMYLDSPGTIYVLVTAFVNYGSGWRTSGTRLIFDGSVISDHAIDSAYSTVCHAYAKEVGAGWHTVDLYFSGDPGCRIGSRQGFMMAAKR